MSKPTGSGAAYAPVGETPTYVNGSVNNKPSEQQQQGSIDSNSPFTQENQQNLKDAFFLPVETRQMSEKQHCQQEDDTSRKQRKHVEELYHAAVVADQNAKLSAFTTRPAINAPPFNWLTEFMATVMLITGSKLMSAQLSRQGLAGAAIGPLYTGLFIVCQVTGPLSRCMVIFSGLFILNQSRFWIIRHCSFKKKNNPPTDGLMIYHHL